MLEQISKVSSRSHNLIFSESRVSGLMIDNLENQTEVWSQNGGCCWSGSGKGSVRCKWWLVHFSLFLPGVSPSRKVGILFLLLHSQGKLWSYVFVAFFTFCLGKFGMIGLRSKWVSSSISLLTVYITLGSEMFLSGEKVCRKGGLWIQCLVINSNILLYLLNFSISLYKAEHHFRSIYVRWGGRLWDGDSICLVLAVEMNYFRSFFGSRQGINESVNLKDESQN